TIPRAHARAKATGEKRRESETASLFTVAFTVRQFFAAKLRNSAKSRANQLACASLRKTQCATPRKATQVLLVELEIRCPWSGTNRKGCTSQMEVHRPGPDLDLDLDLNLVWADLRSMAF